MLIKPVRACQFCGLPATLSCAWPVPFVRMLNFSALEVGNLVQRQKNRWLRVVEINPSVEHPRWLGKVTLRDVGTHKTTTVQLSGSVFVDQGETRRCATPCCEFHRREVGAEGGVMRAYCMTHWNAWEEAA